MTSLVCLVSVLLKDRKCPWSGQWGGCRDTGVPDSSFLRGHGSCRVALSLQVPQEGSGHHMNSEERKEESQGGPGCLLTEDGEGPAEGGKPDQTPKGRDPGTVNLCNPP